MCGTQSASRAEEARGGLGVSNAAHSPSTPREPHPRACLPFAASHVRNAPGGQVRRAHGDYVSACVGFGVRAERRHRRRGVFFRKIVTSAVSETAIGTPVGVAKTSRDRGALLSPRPRAPPRAPLAPRHFLFVLAHRPHRVRSRESVALTRPLVLLPPPQVLGPPRALRAAHSS